MNIIYNDNNKNRQQQKWTFPFDKKPVAYFAFRFSSFSERRLIPSDSYTTDTHTRAVPLHGKQTIYPCKYARHVCIRMPAVGVQRGGAVINEHMCVRLSVCVWHCCRFLNAKQHEMARRKKKTRTYHFNTHTHTHIHQTYHTTVHSWYIHRLTSKIHIYIYISYKFLYT